MRLFACGKFLKMFYFCFSFNSEHMPAAFLILNYLNIHIFYICIVLNANYIIQDGDPFVQLHQIRDSLCSFFRI